ncbi:MAG TPA: carboxymuconolactone decarboxylase family protein [Burkholderiales bacterium]
MTKDFIQIGQDVRNGSRALREAAPEAMKAFAALAQAATAAGALDTKTKELIALAIGIAGRCDGCIAHHTRVALQLGATREEIAETVAVAIYMGGGPSSIYGAEALRAYDQLAAQAAR